MRFSKDHTATIDRSDVDPKAKSIHIATIRPASEAAVERVLAQSDDVLDGRSNWVWVRLANGDLILGVFPQGDTYLECEGEAP